MFKYQVSAYSISNGNASAAQEWLFDDQQDAARLFYSLCDDLENDYRKEVMSAPTGMCRRKNYTLMVEIMRGEWDAEEDEFVDGMDSTWGNYAEYGWADYSRDN
jgi:hypothetical protein